MIRAKVVSFDCFDTLVFRKSLSHHQMWKNVSKTYFLRRSTAETVARIINRIKGIPEVSSFDVYKRMPIQWGLNFELDLELKDLLPNRVTINLLNQAIAAGAKVCVISDTHYSKENISKLLCSLGIPKVPIFTSSDFGIGKSTGLFSEVKKQLEIDYIDWIHIGDNLHSDISSAKKLGITTFHVPNIKDQLIEVGLMSEFGFSLLKRSKHFGNRVITRQFSNLLSMINEFKSKSLTLPVLLGSVVSDLVATAIAYEIHNMHSVKKYDCILYSSRDGWLPFIAHKTLFPKDPIKYFKTSRNMLRNSHFRDYLSKNIGSCEKILMFDLGWRGSTARKISLIFPEKSWDFVYWQLLGKKLSNQFELNPGKFRNRLRIWRSRDFLETIFTDPSNGFNEIGDDLIPIERSNPIDSIFKTSILEGARKGIELHREACSLEEASLVLEAFSRYPSEDLILYAEESRHQVHEDSTEKLVITTWADLFSASKILWSFGSRHYTGNSFTRTIFAFIVFLKEFVQRLFNLIHRIFKITL